MPSSVTAAVSGGADSVALLHALHALSKEEELSLSVAHVDHCLRPGSKADASFVVNVCRELGIPCRVFEVQVDGSSEDAARNARYEALREACRENGTSVLALAHHLRDQAETLLLHLFRGSGGGGLSAMTEFSQRTWPEGESITLWRPWLSVSPETIRAALKEMCVSWREDETNAGDRYLRNYLRHQVLPAVTARLPRAEEAMSRAARVLAEENAFLLGEAGAFLERNDNACLSGPCRWVRFEPLAKLHPALRRHVVRLASPVKLDWETTEGLTSLNPGRIMNLPEGWRAQCTRRFLHFLPPEDRAVPPAIQADALRELPWKGETGDGIRTQAVPRRVFEACQLRFGQPGDVIHPLGGPGTKSMQDYWVDKKIDRPFRRYMPLLCLGNRVVWAIGAGVGEEARVRAGDSAALLRYEGFLPGNTVGAQREPNEQNDDR